MLKKVLAFTAAAVLALTAASAAEGLDELYHASADAVDNDSVYFGDLLDWNYLMYPQLYGLVSIDSENTGNLGAAVNMKKGAQLHAFWNGNLWEEDAENELSVLYGKDNKAFAGHFYQQVINTNIGADTAKLNVTGIGAGFGMNVNKKFGFTAELAGMWGDGTAGAYDYDASVYSIGGGISYKFREDKTVLSRLYAGWNGTFVNMENDDLDLEVSVNSNTFYAKYKYQYKVAKNFMYGFVGTLPMTIISGDNFETATTFSFNLRNGFVAQVKPTLNFAAGISTDLPSITFQDGDKTKGEFKNSFYMGCGIEVTKSIELDISANIKPTTDDGVDDNGESLDEIWKQSFAISVSIHM